MGQSPRFRDGVRFTAEGLGSEAQLPNCTQRLLCSSFWGLLWYRVVDLNIRPKTELHGRFGFTPRLPRDLVWPKTSQAQPRHGAVTVPECYPVANPHRS